MTIDYKKDKIGEVEAEKDFIDGLWSYETEIFAPRETPDILLLEQEEQLINLTRKQAKALVEEINEWLEWVK